MCLVKNRNRTIIIKTNYKFLKKIYKYKIKSYLYIYKKLLNIINNFF